MRGIFFFFFKKGAERKAECSENTSCSLTFLLLLRKEPRLVPYFARREIGRQQYSFVVCKGE